MHDDKDLPSMIVGADTQSTAPNTPSAATPSLPTKLGNRPVAGMITDMDIINGAAFPRNAEPVDAADGVDAPVIVDAPATVDTAPVVPDTAGQQRKWTATTPWQGYGGNRREFL